MAIQADFGRIFLGRSPHGGAARPQPNDGVRGVFPAR